MSLVIVSRISESRVSKCCDENEMFYLEKMMCHSEEKMINDVYQPTVYKNLLANLSLSPNMQIKPNFLAHQKSGLIPNCSDFFQLDSDEDFSIDTKTGQLLQEGYNRTDAYCVDLIHPGAQLLVLKCFPEDPLSEKCSTNHLESPEAYKLLFTSLGVASQVFLIITFLVYMIIPDLNNIHGKIVLSNVVAMFLVTLYLITVYQTTSDHTQTIFCVTLGYLGYYTSLAMFVWMTVFCFDLCSTFTSSGSPNRSPKKILYYSTIGWGLPLAITLIVLALDNMTPLDYSDIKPNFGHSSCFIQDTGIKRMIYFHLPVMLMMMINLILYIITVFYLSRHNQQTRHARESRRLNSGDNVAVKFGKDSMEELMLFTKLFFILGILWTFSCLHYLIHNHQTQDHHNCDQEEFNTSLEIFFRIIDCLNLLRGLFFFLIFTCKKKVLGQLTKLFQSPVQRRESCLETQRFEMTEV